MYYIFQIIIVALFIALFVLDIVVMKKTNKLALKASSIIGAVFIVFTVLSLVLASDLVINLIDEMNDVSLQFAFAFIFIAILASSIAIFSYFIKNQFIRYLLIVITIITLIISMHRQIEILLTVLGWNFW